MSHDVDVDGAVGGDEAELDAAAVRRPAERVREQVRDHLQHTVAVGDDHGQLVGGLEPVLDLAPTGFLGERSVRMIEDAPEVDLLLANGEAMRLELREVEHVADEALEPDRLGRDDVERDPHLIGLRHDPLAQRLDVAADRGKRRPQLVRDRHQEGALELLRLGELGDHAPESIAQLRDLVGPSCGWNLHVVAARGDVLGRARQREHGVGKATREPPEENAAQRDPDRQRQREPAEKREPLLAKLRRRLRDDEPADRRRAASRGARALPRR